MATGKRIQFGRLPTTAVHIIKAVRPRLVAAATLGLLALAHPSSRGQTDLIPQGLRGGIYAEHWHGIPGWELSDLTLSAQFQQPGDEALLLTRFEAPTDRTDEFGSRIAGYVHPPADGWYTFAISADDRGYLWLSADDSAANATLIAHTPDWTARHQFWYPEQISQPVHLQAGERYYIQALGKEALQGDHLAVFWTRPDGVFEIIPGAFLSPLQPLPTTWGQFESLAGFSLNGDAAVINYGAMGAINEASRHVLRLTDNLGQSGSAFVSEPITLGSDISFSAAFQFQMTRPMGIYDMDGQGADGIVFVVHTNPNLTGGSGGGIGYAGIPNSIGIEFDNWHNPENGEGDGNHVGLNVNGSMSSAILQPVGTRLNDGQVWSAWVDYNGATHHLEVFLSESNVRPSTPIISANVDIQQILGSSSVFVGFTAGTGGAGHCQDILTWQFNTIYDPIIDLPPPVRPPVADAGADIGIAANSSCEGVVLLDGSASLNPDGGALTYIWSGPFGELEGAVQSVPLPLGVHEVTLTVQNEGGATASDTLIVTVYDDSPPVVAGATADPAVLWAPNHKMVDVTVTVEAQDNCGGAVASEIIEILSNEPSNGSGDGNTAQDFVITGPLTASLRAERAGVGAGRVYTLVVRTVDAAGNAAYTNVEVRVSKNAGK